MRRQRLFDFGILISFYLRYVLDFDILESLADAREKLRTWSGELRKLAKSAFRQSISFMPAVVIDRLFQVYLQSGNVKSGKKRRLIGRRVPNGIRKAKTFVNRGVPKDIIIPGASEPTTQYHKRNLFVALYNAYRWH